MAKVIVGVEYSPSILEPGRCHPTGVVLTDLQSLCDCQQNSLSLSSLSLSLSLSLARSLSLSSTSDTDARAFGCVVMVDEAARDSHTILMVAICHLLVRVPHQIDQRRGLKSIHMAHRR